MAGGVERVPHRRQRQHHAGRRFIMNDAHRLDRMRRVGGKLLAQVGHIDTRAASRPRPSAPPAHGYAAIAAHSSEK